MIPADIFQPFVDTHAPFRVSVGHSSTCTYTVSPLSRDTLRLSGERAHFDGSPEAVLNRLNGLVLDQGSMGYPEAIIEVTRTRCIFLDPGKSMRVHIESGAPSCDPTTPGPVDIRSVIETQIGELHAVVEITMGRKKRTFDVMLVEWQDAELIDHSIYNPPRSPRGR